ncbi:leucine-rich repeat-containing protein 24 isoform X2 [Bombus impatiens]|uniref:Leucine-rich repeat-containing protein 24 isoform X2 n=1 Tax=Bombus impatiens TaxID=132113 RepID=A0A6P8LBH2_BOMIM|nr:leucine-rich repeat-containing protein 24 isoform X2 [Bombus impatiens]XP_033175697.1 leucine-rich repeat-containing protein 24 isoform X2 [Bombus impatiens]
MIGAMHHPLRGRILLALFILLSTFALLSKAVAFPDWTDCPATCRCKWTSGKKSALCYNASLTSLPANLDPDMQVLDLSGNKIPALQSEIFKRSGLVNLQRVFLRNAGIYKIHADSFRDMRILVEIDLSDNHVEMLEPDTFLGNERLRILILSGNPLGKLRSHQFPILQHLRNLELQRCSLSEIHGEAFVHLTGLESLRLDHNELEYLDVSVISSLPRLKTLTLDGNQWSCDCRLRDFRIWLIPSRPSKLYSVPQVCSSPMRLEGRKWEDVKPAEFACEPEVFVLASSIQEETNGNLSLACLATGDPEPEVWWQLNGGPVNATKLTEQTYSGTYVAYATSDVDMAYNERVPSSSRLTDRWNNLTVYNASDGDAGEYSCFAKNIAGLARDTVSVAIPRVYTAPTLSQSDNWLLWVSLAGGGAAALCASISAVLLALCVCGGTRRQRAREKVKLQGSTSFGDQEKKLLDLSVTTTTPGNSNDRGSGHGSIVEACSTGDLELAERGSICDPMSAATVTVERLRPEVSSGSVTAMRAVPCAAMFPPPPPEFTSGVLPAGIFGNIFISVSMPQDSSDRCYPDLLDIPVHGTSGVVNKTTSALPAASSVSSFATLPRRALRSSDLCSPYDNMGPRVTANGSSAFSLTDADLRLSPPPHTTATRVCIPMRDVLVRPAFEQILYSTEPSTCVNVPQPMDTINWTRAVSKTSPPRVCMFACLTGLHAWSAYNGCSQRKRVQ